MVTEETHIWQTTESNRMATLWYFSVQEVGVSVTSIVDAVIKRANEFGNQIEELVLAKGKAPTGDRNTLTFVDFWTKILAKAKCI